MTPEEIQAVFLQECEEGLTNAEAALLAIRSGAFDAETINTIFRAVHSIKGGAGAFGFSALQFFTHHFETLLDKVRDGDVAVQPAVVDLLIAAFDMLTDHVAAVRGERGEPDHGAMIAALQDVLTTRRDSPAAAPAAPSGDTCVPDLAFDLDAMLGELTASAVAQEWEVSFAPAGADMRNGGDPLLLVQELIRLGGSIVRIDTDRLPPIDGFDPDQSYLSWVMRLPGALDRAAIAEVFDFVSDEARVDIQLQPVLDDATAAEEPVSLTQLQQEPQEVEAGGFPPASAIAPTPAPVAAKGAGPTIRVDLEKLDRLVNLVGELVITQSMLSQRLGSNAFTNVEEIALLDQLTRELQDSAMAIRAQPVKTVFSRIPRLVRELEASTGKRVRLEVDGEATELDKTVIERIGEPLTHLVRNCVDHGIEAPEVRAQAGKPAEGCLRLAAEHKGSRIVISVSDDGGGIDRARVRDVAVDRGIIAPDVKLSDEEIDQLIFAPGFSTARQVSNISGRGVGMDVVRQNVQALGGRISIRSEPGRGSSFALSLPLTLAIVDGMIVSVGDQSYIIPLTHVVESLRPAPGAVQRTGLGNRILNVRGTFLPVLAVGDLLGVDQAIEDPAQAVLIVVETERSGSAILMVDEIADQRQVVIKSLETHYRQVDGVAGATISGDGRVALILDVENLVGARVGGGGRQWAC